MPWRKIDSDTFAEEMIMQVRMVKLSVLKARLTELEAIPKPTKDELIVWVKENHPYFLELAELKKRYDELKAKEPSVNELVDHALLTHPYYMAQSEIAMLKEVIAILGAL